MPHYLAFGSDIEHNATIRPTQSYLPPMTIRNCTRWEYYHNDVQTQEEEFETIVA